MTTPAEFRRQAAEARAAGDRTRARDLEDEALGLSLQIAADRVRRIEEELDAARVTRLVAMEDALDRGWTYARISRSVGLTQQRVGAMFRGDES